MNLTDQVSNLSQRVGALESGGFDDNSTITRIIKIYGNITMKVSLSVDLHQYPVCSNSILCSDTLSI